MKNILNLFTLLIITLIFSGCSREDPPAPGEKTDYPGLISGTNLGTITFWYDGYTCGYGDQLSLSLYGDTTIYYYNLSPTNDAFIDCVNSYGTGYLIQLPAGTYFYEASEVLGGRVWQNKYVTFTAGGCIDWRLFCN